MFGTMFENRFDRAGDCLACVPAAAAAAASEPGWPPENNLGSEQTSALSVVATGKTRQDWMDTMLQISSEKVGYIILKAKEVDAKVANWDDAGDYDEAADDPQSLLEDIPGDATRAELASYIDALNTDEQVNLVALAWLGRGSYSADEFDEAVKTATQEQTSPTATYLLGMPLLGDYLADGLEQMGVSALAAEESILGFEETQAGSFATMDRTR